MSSYCYRRYVSRFFQRLGKKTKPTDEDEQRLACLSHKHFLQHDIIESSHTGGFHLLPFGVKALEKLVRLVDEEMESIGAQKISLTTLAPHALWEKTGRWEASGPELFKIQDRHKNLYCLGPTHEELVTKMVSNMSAFSYKALPLRLYQITRKFRDEMQPKYGLLRGREFEMKDMYTFDTCKDTALETYEEVVAAYDRIFDRIGVKYVKVLGSTGLIGGDLSHEYHFLGSAGQDSLLICDRCGVSMNKELAEEDGSLPSACQLPASQCELQEKTGIEVGHTFYLGDKYSSVFKASYVSPESEYKLYSMGCYGLGMTRILQASVEDMSTEKDIRWPRILAPYQIIIIPKKDQQGADFLELAERLSDDLTTRRHLQREVVIDDRMSITIGSRQVDARRQGYPYTLIIGKKIFDTPPLIEVIDNYSGETVFLTQEQLHDFVDKIVTI